MSKRKKKREKSDPSMINQRKLRKAKKEKRFKKYCADTFLQINPMSKKDYSIRSRKVKALVPGFPFGWTVTDKKGNTEIFLFRDSATNYLKHLVAAARKNKEYKGSKYKPYKKAVHRTRKWKAPNLQDRWITKY